MLDKALTFSAWDIAAAQSIAGEQRWVLSAIQKNGRELVNMLWRILGNEQDVCDAYQDTFLQLAHFEGGRKPSNIKAYLFRTANNVAISMLRRKTAERNKIEKSAADKTEEFSPVKDLDSKLLQEILRQYIAELPEHLRSVLVMHDFAELSYRQIGSILNISMGTARVYRCKAVQLLAFWMSKEE
jgi:RNA polymerase sigma factor (sigma-70 family)